MKSKMKGISCLLLCSFALGGSLYASVAQHKHKYYKGERIYKGEVSPRNFNHFEVIGAPGIAKLNAGNSELGVTSSETDKLVQTNASNWNTFAAQLGAGYVYYFGHAQPCADQVQWFPSVEPELNVYYLSSNSIDGNVWRFNSSAFNDLTFDIPVHSTRLMLDAALTVASYKRFSVYALGGLGNAWSRIGYSDTDNTSPTCTDQRLSLNTKSNSTFAWEAGAGLNFAFNDRFGLSLEYLYADLGKVKTRASGSLGGITAPVIVPAQFRLKTQSVLLGLHVALG